MSNTKTRMTKQRKAILEILKSTDVHPTADWIYEQVKKEIPNISLGTVYRNLNVLAENNEISILDYGSTYSRYDGNPQNHYHFKCLECEKIFDLEQPIFTDIDKKINQETPFQTTHHRLEFYGYCPDCQKKLD